MDIISMLPDESIDAIITDFPYGINFQSNHRADKFIKIDNDEAPYVEWINPSFNKLKSGGRLICFYRFDVQEELFLALTKSGFEIKSQIIWDKGNWSLGDLKGTFGAQHELMVYATKGRYEFKNGRPSSIIRCPRVPSDKMIHGNEKPVELNRHIIKIITEPGELIFEPFSGSGSLPVAAKLEGREFIACDTQKNNVINGNERLKNTQKSLI